MARDGTHREMAISTDPQDPSFGLETDNTNPNFGLPAQSAPTPQSQTGVYGSQQSGEPQLSPNQSQSLTESIFGAAANAGAEGLNLIKGIPRMIESLPGQAYQGLKFATGGPQEKAQVLEQAAAEALPQGRQIAQDVQSPLGSRESFRGLFQLGMLAIPSLTETIFGRATPEIPIETEKPPIQAVEPIKETQNAIQEPSTSGVLPQSQETVAETGGQRVGVGQGVQGEEVAKTGEPQPQEQVADTGAPKPVPAGEITPSDYAKHLPNVEWPFGEATKSVPFDKVEIVNQGSKSGVGSKQANWTVKLRNQDNIISDESFGGRQSGRQAAENFAKEMQSRIDTGAKPAVPVSTEGEAPTAQGNTKEITPTAETPTPTGEVPPQGQAAPPTEKPPVQPEQPPISTKNEYTEAQRATRGFPEAEQAAKRDFGTVWDEATAQAEKDPNVGQRLVNELNNKPRTVSDTENAHLLRTEIAAQTEHSAAVEAVNSAKTPEDLTAAKSRLELARQDLQNVYDATKRAGTKSGQALAARQMLAKEDYTLAAMEAKRRAANDGLPLNEKQLSEVSALHEKIADLQSKLDTHEVVRKFNVEFDRLVNETRKEARTAKSTTKFTDFMDRKADEARARITERRGRLTTGFDPTAITDEAIIGASHIAKGIVKFTDWSAEMVGEFGDAVRPFLKDIWEKAKAFHAETGKEYGDKNLARYKTYLSKQTEQIKGKLEVGDFNKAERQRTKLDAEAFTMRADLQKLKNEFERGVAKEAYQNKSPAQKFWDHFVGVERAMKLSGPEVFGKLGVAAAVREAVVAPVESGVGYAASKAFPRLTAGTKYGADLSTVVRAELKAKAALFTKGMQDAAQNVAGKETALDAIGGKYGRQPTFWYNRVGNMHAAVKAPVKRAEFTRSLEQRMDAAVKAGEDIHHPEVMTRLANESVMDANRAIFQQNTVVSSFFSMLDRQVPAAGRVARFLFPVVKIPVNLFKEVVNYHAGAPIAAAKIGRAYLKGVETLPVVEREAIIRQLTKGSVGGAALLWGYFNSDKVRDFFDNAPHWFSHTPLAMVLNEGSYLKKLQGTDEEKKQAGKELGYMAKTDIPFMYSVKDVTDALDTHNSKALLGWINNMVQSTVVPQVLTQTAKNIDKPGSFPSNLSERTNYRVPSNPLEAVKLGIPGLRQTVPSKEEIKQERKEERRAKSHKAKTPTGLDTTPKN